MPIVDMSNVMKCNNTHTHTHTKRTNKIENIELNHSTIVRRTKNFVENAINFNERIKKKKNENETMKTERKGESIDIIVRTRKKKKL